MSELEQALKRIQLLERKVNREKSARLQAEQMLEQKSLVLFHRNQELQQLSEKLELQVKQRTQQLENARDEALSANRAKSAFLANMSHEMRTPLTAIIGFSENIEQGLIEPKDVPQAIERILNSGQHLLALINDLLDTTKIEAQQMTVEWVICSPHQIIQQVQETIQPQANRKGLVFSTRCKSLPKQIKTDPFRLKQVLLNLCSNAIKFTEHGQVELAVQFNADKGTLHFLVADTGIGFTEQQAEHIFHPFKQAENSTTRKYGGTGLGLYISKKLTHLLGGELAYRSSPGQGTEFWFEIESGVSQPSSLQGPTAISKPSETFTLPKLSGWVLLAEDTLINQQLIKFNIEKTGAKVVIAENGIQAVEQVNHRHFDLILMDIQMPEMDGKQAISVIKNQSSAPPIYALTANVQKEDIEEYLALGFKGTLAKPLEMNAFYQVLNQHLTTENQ